MSRFYMKLPDLGKGESNVHLEWTFDVDEEVLPQVREWFGLNFIRATSVIEGDLTKYDFECDADTIEELIEVLNRKTLFSVIDSIEIHKN